MCNHDDDWPFEYETPAGPSNSNPRTTFKRKKLKGKLSARLSVNGNSGKQTYLSTYRKRMAMADKKPSPFRSKSGSKSTATTTNSKSRSNKEDAVPVSTKKSTVKSTTTKSASTRRRSASKKTTVKQGVILHLVREPAGKGGYRFDNSHDRDEKLDVTTAYVSQKDMKKNGAFALALVKEPAGKGGVRFANSAKEKLDVTTMYLSQNDRALLGVDDSVSMKVTEDDNGWFVTVTP